MKYPRECCSDFWLYDGLIKYGVKIEALDYDYWYGLEKVIVVMSLRINLYSMLTVRHL